VRIVVSGSHAVGKSTLVSDFALRHPEYEVLGDPYELLSDESGAAMPAGFLQQLRLSAARLRGPSARDLIAERGPLDFLAYLMALERLERADPRPVLERARELTLEAMDGIDLLVVVPVDPGAGIAVPAEEDPELRSAMDAELLDLVDELPLASRIEFTAGDPAMRLSALERWVRA
jgi:hypothetical protein